MKTPTLSKYIDDVSDRSGASWVFVAILDFNKFWQSKPELGHFTPCDKNNKPLEKPKLSVHAQSRSVQQKHAKRLGEYQEAQSRVKWEEFEIVEGTTKYHLKKPNEGARSLLAYIDKAKPFELLNEILGNKSYGQLITAGIELEPTKPYAHELKL